MRFYTFGRRRTVLAGLAVLVLAAGIVAAAPLNLACRVSTPVTIVNNTNRDVSHVYLSPTNEDKWGPDLLNDAAISPGATVTLNDVACSGADIKVIAEDQEGCFVYKIVSCGESTTWTITSETARNCGS